MRSTSFVVLCAAAVVALFSSGASAASTFNLHTLEKRQAEEEEAVFVDEEQEKELSMEERVELVYTVINQTDPKECYPRLLCEMAGSDTGYDHFRYLVGIFGGSMDDELKKLSKELQDFSSKLRSYIETGKTLKNVEECRAKYECEFTGEQIEEHTAFLEQQIVSLLPGETVDVEDVKDVEKVD